MIEGGRPDDEPSLYTCPFCTVHSDDEILMRWHWTVKQSCGRKARETGLV